ncbi:MULTISPECIES: hypothetical protein [unclassified Rhizobium]|uniref:hypothetical protein n=1 Tax=unclassified Rhizobium TaxID=2613769 RepID=UPI00288A6E6E|nr:MULTISPECIES: hypothetical protein [unclassified Rhizobium]
MTAMSQARQPTEAEGLRSQAPVKSATTILQGALVVSENGLAIPGKLATGLVVLGVSEQTVKNTGADGAQKVPFRRGTFGFNNHGADAISAGDVNKTAYIVDDQTVAKTDASGTRSAAGKIMHIEGGQIFVRVGY